MKNYSGLIPCCGIFCGGCSNYIRIKNTCFGAEKQCVERRCGIYKCCVEKKSHRFCFECKTFPCSKFKKFAETWLKIGQDLIANQNFLKELGEENFLNYFNLEKVNRMEDITIRKLETFEYTLLENMLYEAVYQSDENNLIPREVVNIPAVRVYIDKFGEQEDDYCLVADLNGKIVGAVWIRILAGKIKGFGYIDNKTPEFAISLFKEYRGKGIGLKLMQEMIGYMIIKGYEQASLSVRKENYAVNLYKKVGFKIVEENNEDYIMLLNLK